MWVCLIPRHHETEHMKMDLSVLMIIAVIVITVIRPSNTLYTLSKYNTHPGLRCCYIR